ncbi:putative signal transducing protein [Psychroserpens sp. MEBiC05023]
MIDHHKIIATFPYSTEAQITKSKLEAEGISVILLDEKTIDSDPLISQAIGGVKLLVPDADFEKAAKIYNDIRQYETDDNGNPISCPTCQSEHILIAPLERKNIFYMLFPFFEQTKYICNTCKTIFK